MNIKTFLYFIIFFALPASTWIVNCRNYRYYKTVYKTLPHRKFYRNFDQVYSHTAWEIDDDFVWFTNLNTFKLCKGVYLAEYNTLFDPYATYWLWKYRKWFKKNIDFDRLPKFTEV